jgi:hypothetical protein
VKQQGKMPGEFISALEGANQIDITVTGRVTGREIALPVWFAEEAGKLYLLPVRGSDSDWFKNVRKTPGIRLAADGTSLTARAAPITDPSQVADVVGKFQEKYGTRDIAAYYSQLNAAVEVDLGER